MPMLHHQVQIHLDENRYRKLEREAERRGIPIIEAILSAEPMEPPTDPAELRRELDAAHDSST